MFVNIGREPLQTVLNILHWYTAQNSTCSTAPIDFLLISSHHNKRVGIKLHIYFQHTYISYNSTR